MESARRNRKRKPFSNLTNLTSTTTTTTPKSIDTSIGSNNADAPNPRLPTQSLQSPPNIAHASRTESRTAVAQRRRHSGVGAKHKEKEVVPFSCPPAGRTGAIGDEVQKDQPKRHKLRKNPIGVCLSKSSVSSINGKEQSPIVSEEDANSIHKQIAYFSEIDAFELAEEVVSEAELE